MALTKDQKQTQVQDLTTKMSDASSIIFANYIGLSVAEISELRSKLREAGAEMKVAKKTLMKLAASDAKLPDFEEASLEGPVSLIFSYGDPLGGAQVAFKFSKEHDKVSLIGGVFEGNLLTKEQAMELAEMPSREQLLSMFVGMIRSPLVSFASMCNSPLTGFARALNEMSLLRQDSGEQAPPPDPTPTEEAPAEEAEEAKEEIGTEDSEEKDSPTETETPEKEE